MGIRDEQLKKCEFADLSNFDANTNTYHIPRYTKPTYDIGKCYIIQVPDRLINNTNSIEAVNWNKCTAPSNKYLKIYVSKQLGKMIYIDSVGYDLETKRDLNNLWSGWLPIEEITQIASF